MKAIFKFIRKMFGLSLVISGFGAIFMGISAEESNKTLIFFGVLISVFGVVLFLLKKRPRPIAKIIGTNNKPEFYIWQEDDNSFTVENLRKGGLYSPRFEKIEDVILFTEKMEEDWE